ncbi:MAG: hypothetical protein ACOCQ5_04225 [Halanaerobiales bacterium]
MDRKEFIKSVDMLTDRELRQLFNFIYQFFEERDKDDLLKDEIDSIKDQRNL